MIGTVGREFAHERRFGAVQAAEQLVKRAEHLLGERGRNQRLGVTATFQKCGQAPIVGIRKEPEAIEQQLQAAEHRSAGDHRHGPDRKTLIARRLAARRIDQAEFGIGANLAILALIPLRNQQPGKDAGVAQQPLETLMRRRLPAVERVPGIGIDTGRFDAHEKLPAAIALPEFGDRPGRREVSCHVPAARRAIHREWPDHPARPRRGALPSQAPVRRRPRDRRRRACEISDQ